jgi:hypothetical protein
MGKYVLSMVACTIESSDNWATSSIDWNYFDALSLSQVSIKLGFYPRRNVIMEKFSPLDRVEVIRTNPFDIGLFDWTLNEKGTVLAYTTSKTIRKDVPFGEVPFRPLVKLDNYKIPIFVEEEYLIAIHGTATIVVSE